MGISFLHPSAIGFGVWGLRAPNPLELLLQLADSGLKLLFGFFLFCDYGINLNPMLFHKTVVLGLGVVVKLLLQVDLDIWARSSHGERKDG